MTVVEVKEYKKNNNRNRNNNQNLNHKNLKNKNLKGLQENQKLDSLLELKTILINLMFNIHHKNMMKVEKYYNSLIKNIKLKKKKHQYQQ